MDARALFNLVHRQGSVVVAGMSAVRELRGLLKQLRKSAGITFVFDPDSDPALADYLVAAGVAAVEAGVITSVMGALLGTMLRASFPLALVGGVVGGVLGGLAGVWAVDKGSRAQWKILTWYEGKVPHAMIQRG